MKFIIINTSKLSSNSTYDRLYSVLFTFISRTQLGVQSILLLIIELLVRIRQYIILGFAVNEKKKISPITVSTLGPSHFLIYQQSHCLMNRTSDHCPVPTPFLIFIKVQHGVAFLYVWDVVKTVHELGTIEWMFEEPYRLRTLDLGEAAD